MKQKNARGFLGRFCCFFVLTACGLVLLFDVEGFDAGNLRDF